MTAVHVRQLLRALAMFTTSALLAAVVAVLPMPALAQASGDAAPEGGPAVGPEVALWAPKSAGSGPDGLGPLVPPPLRPVTAAEPVAADALRPAPTLLARGLGIDLFLPHDTVAVGYHESGNPLSAALEPIGQPVGNHNPARVAVEPNAEAPAYVVLPTRHRAGGPTTAVDLSMHHGVAVSSPVSGVVTDVREYLLYGRHPDVFVDIEPHGRPDLRVRVMHMAGPLVNIGDHVVAGDSTLAATASQLPFPSQIDRWAGPLPHVHLEVHHLAAAL